MRSRVAYLRICGWGLLSAIACSDPMTFSISLIEGEPTDRPLAEIQPAVFINGEAVRQLDVVYESPEAAEGTWHRIELRYGTSSVSALDFQISRESCLFQVESATAYHQSFCALSSGDLRFASERAVGGDDSCLVDAFCLPACGKHLGNDGCSPSERCTSLVTSTSPLASHLGCAPIGEQGVGQACALEASDTGSFDNCGRDLLCVEGVCRPVCLGNSNSCPGCTYIPGHAPELRLCP